MLAILHVYALCTMTIYDVQCISSLDDNNGGNCVCFFIYSSCLKHLQCCIRFLNTLLSVLMDCNVWWDKTFPSSLRYKAATS